MSRGPKKHRVRRYKIEREEERIKGEGKKDDKKRKSLMIKDTDIQRAPSTSVGKLGGSIGPSTRGTQPVETFERGNIMSRIGRYSRTVYRRNLNKTENNKARYFFFNPGALLGSSSGSRAAQHAAIDVLLLLLGRFENLDIRVMLAPDDSEIRDGPRWGKRGNENEPGRNTADSHRRSS